MNITEHKPDELLSMQICYKNNNYYDIKTERDINLTCNISEAATSMKYLQ